MPYPATEGTRNANARPMVAKTDYAVNGGTYRILGAGPPLACEIRYNERDYLKDPYNMMPECQWANNATTLARFDGISCERSEVTLQDVYDGTSNTMLAGEKYLNLNLYFTGSDGADNNSAYQGNDWDVVRWTFLVPWADTPGFDTCSSRFGSAHSAVFFAAFCDGSVRGIDYTVDPAAFAMFGNRRDSRP